MWLDILRFKNVEIARNYDNVGLVILLNTGVFNEYSGRFSITCPVRGNHHSGRVEIINMQLELYCFRSASERRYALTKPSSNDILLSCWLRVISLFRNTDSQLIGHPISDKQNIQLFAIMWFLSRFYIN